jgi:hypothetical protein
VALQAQVDVVEHIGLVGAVRAGEDALAARRDGEGVAVPLEGVELAQVSPNHARAACRLDAHGIPADLLHRIARHLAAEGAREHLPPRQWPITGTRRATASRMSASTGWVHGSSSLALIGPPMNARPANASLEAAPGRLVELHQLPRHPVGVEERGKMARPFGIREAEYRRRFHGCPR